MGSRGWAKSIRRERARIRPLLRAAGAAWRAANAQRREPTAEERARMPGLFGLLDVTPLRAPWERPATEGSIGGRPRTNPLMAHGPPR